MLRKIAGNKNLAFSQSAHRSPRAPSSSMLQKIAGNQNLAFSQLVHRSPGVSSSSMLQEIADNQNLAFSKSLENHRQSSLKHCASNTFVENI